MSLFTAVGRRSRITANTHYANTHYGLHPSGFYLLITPVGRRRHSETQGFRPSCAILGLVAWKDRDRDRSSSWMILQQRSIPRDALWCHANGSPLLGGSLKQASTQPRWCGCAIECLHSHPRARLLTHLHSFLPHSEHDAVHQFDAPLHGRPYIARGKRCLDDCTREHLAHLNHVLLELHAMHVQCTCAGRIKERDPLPIGVGCCQTTHDEDIAELLPPEICAYCHCPRFANHCCNQQRVISRHRSQQQLRNVATRDDALHSTLQTSIGVLTKVVRHHRPRTDIRAAAVHLSRLHKVVQVSYLVSELIRN